MNYHKIQQGQGKLIMMLVDHPMRVKKRRMAVRMMQEVTERADPYNVANVCNGEEVVDVCYDAGERGHENKHASPAGGACYSDYQRLGRQRHGDELSDGVHCYRGICLRRHLFSLHNRTAAHDRVRSWNGNYDDGHFDYSVDGSVCHPRCGSCARQ